MEKNIENLNKEKEIVIPGSEEQKKKSEPEIVVHSMPKRYSESNSGAKQAKYVGIMILVGGVIFVIAALAAGYYFLIYKPNNQPAQDNQEQMENRDSGQAEQEKSEDSSANSPRNGEQEEQEEEFVEDDPNEEDLEEEFVEEEIEMEDDFEDELIEEDFINLSVDTDQDGLTDTEEMLFGSNVNETDTDEDGYEDLSEVLNLYDPNGKGKIYDNKNIEKYTNSKFSYSLYYPNVWLVDEVDEQNSIIFRLGKNQFIQIIVQANEDKQKIEEWYKSQFEVNAIDENLMINKQNWLGIKSEDGLIVYLAGPENNNIITVTYNLGLDDTLYYKNIFEMMVNSLEIGD